MSVKITALEAENVKRIKAVALTPAPTGLTLVGGNNNQGKTSVLDALAWALGGEKFRPNAAQRDGAVAPAHLRVTLSNGVVVERKGKNSSLTVTDPTGRRSGQQLLNAFVEPLALDLPRFMEASDKEKADILLRIIGIGNELHLRDISSVWALAVSRRPAPSAAQNIPASGAMPCGWSSQPAKAAPSRLLGTMWRPSSTPRRSRRRRASPLPQNWQTTTSSSGRMMLCWL